METVKVDIQKLQLLNDRVAQTIDALNQVRMSVYGIQHSPAQAAPWGHGGAYAGYPTQSFGFAVVVYAVWAAVVVCAVRAAVVRAAVVCAGVVCAAVVCAVRTAVRGSVRTVGLCDADRRRPPAHERTAHGRVGDSVGHLAAEPAVRDPAIRDPACQLGDRVAARNLVDAVRRQWHLAHDLGSHLAAARAAVVRADPLARYDLVITLA